MLTSYLIWGVMGVYLTSICFTVMGLVINSKVTSSPNKTLLTFLVIAVLLILGVFVYELFTFTPSHQAAFELFLIVSSIVSICMTAGVFVYSNMVRTLHNHTMYKEHYTRCKEINLEKEIQEIKEDKEENIKALKNIIFSMHKLNSCSQRLKRKYTTHARG